MATYKRFEDLPVWKAAIRLAEQVYRLTDDTAFKGQYSLRDQIERAAVSVSNNIAEGFERGTTKELLAFLYIARGSAGEVRSMLCLFERLERFGNLKSQILDLKSTAAGCSRQLRAWADSLQNSDIEGQRHLNEKSKKKWRESKEKGSREAEWREQLIEVLGADHPAIPPVKPKA
ncbi:four helix bundle protein [Puniceicoccaceae bacterium K14]|nr:four helix bundle protein [Puniceicoccaceae bacterium K14]